MPTGTSYKWLTIENQTPTGAAAQAIQSNFQAIADNAEIQSNKNQPSGYAGLNSSGDLVGTIVVRNDTAANLASVILAQGQMAYATDTKRLAVGDGSTTFQNIIGVVIGSKNFSGAGPGNLISGITMISGDDNFDTLGNAEDVSAFSSSGTGFMVGGDDTCPTILDSFQIYTDGHGDVVILSDGTQSVPALTVNGAGSGLSAINITNIPTGTKASPPSGLNPGDLWADTTDSASNPIIRINVS